MIRIALVTVTFNGETVWPEFYASLVAQKDVDWHLIVVDNASKDGSVAAVEAAAMADPRITLLANTDNIGVAAGNNQGTRLALEMDFELIALINNDTSFGSGMLRQLAHTLERESVGAVSPLIPFYDEPDLCWYAGGHFSGPRGMLSLHDGMGKPLPTTSRPFQTDYAPTCCVLFKADVFRTVGLMDEAYFVYWDDVDFLWRMKNLGVIILVDPSAVMLHKVSVSTGGRLSDFSIRFGHRNQIYFARKHFGSLYASYVSAFTTVVGLARMAVVGDTWHHFCVRMAAVGEGWRMSLPQPLSLPSNSDESIL
jgi:GT2 family glycosyltransferase